MIDLTPLDVRNKRGDFKKIMRGYDPPEVDVFLELVAERLEALVRENLKLRERTTSLQDQVSQQSDRERAVQDALVTAQELRADIQSQAQREADHALKEAQSEAKRLIADAEAEVRRLLMEADEEVRDRLRGIERRVDQAHSTLEGLERSRSRFLSDYRSLLQRELAVVESEEERTTEAEGAERKGATAVAGVGAATAAPPAEIVEVTEPSAEASVDDTDVSVAAPSGEVELSADSSGALESSVDRWSDQLESSVTEVESSVGDLSEGLDEGRAEPVESYAAEADTGDETDDALPAPPVEAAPEADPNALGDGAVRSQGVEISPPTPEVFDLPDRFGRKSTSSDYLFMSTPARAADEMSAELDGRTVDVEELGPEPSSLDYDLMAQTDVQQPTEVRNEGDGNGFPNVPDLETVLAEAGIEEVVPPPAEPPPPTQSGNRPDNLILFDPDHKRPNEPGR